MMSSFGQGKIGRNGVVNLDLPKDEEAAAEEVQPQMVGNVKIKAEQSVKTLQKQVPGLLSLQDQKKLEQTLERFNENFDRYEVLKKQPIWLVLSSMATAAGYDQVINPRLMS